MTERVLDAGSASKLPVFASVFGAYRNVLARPASLLRVSALPAAAMAATAFAIIASPLWDEEWGFFALSLLALPLPYAALGWLRHRLLAERPQVLMTGRWLGRYGRLLAFSCTSAIWLICLPFCIVIASVLLLVELAERPWEYAPYVQDGSLPGLLWLGLIMLFALPAGRLLLFAPVIAIGEPGWIQIVWRNGRGYGIRISLALMLLFLMLFIIQFLVFFIFFVLAAILSDLLGSGTPLTESESFIDAGAFVIFMAGALVGTVLSAELLAIAFKAVTGWHHLSNDVLERFE